MKKFITNFLLATIILVVFGLILSLGRKAYFINSQPVLDDTPMMHDWECKYIILDGYSTDIHTHYVSDYTENIDGSISFIGDDGLVWRIPYPYFSITKNEKEAR